MTGRRTGPRLDLDEDECVVLLDHDVDLTPCTPPIALHHPVPLRGQPFHGAVFAVPAECSSFHVVASAHDDHRTRRSTAGGERRLWRSTCHGIAVQE
ncbi:hypothetical protein Cus16_0062 [Curtobacterium sp. ER1/6]|nr:hypothetical protein Cus16_0062 [Curtobacterium sp. ER1/6]